MGDPFTITEGQCWLIFTFGVIVGLVMLALYGMFAGPECGTFELYDTRIDKCVTVKIGS